MYIVYNPQGRFANNCFQYFATKVIQKLINENYRNKFPDYKGDICQFVDVNSSQRQTLLATNKWVRVDDNIFINLYNSLKANLFNNFNSNFYMDGFYQFDFFMSENLEYIKSLINSENKDSINAKYSISDLYSAFNRYQRNEFTDEDLIVHIRLDDFVNEGRNSYVMSDKTYFNTIKIIQNKHKFNNIYIVVDKIRRVWENQYINSLLLNLKNIGITNISVLPTSDLLTDMTRLYSAKNVLCSNSTFCWIPVLLGKCEKNWLPNKNTCSNQRFFKINNHTQIYPMEYLYMTKEESVELI